MRVKAKDKKKLALRVDFHSSVLKLARHAAMLKNAQAFNTCVPVDKGEASVNRFRTAKRFSLARARSADARLAYGPDH